MPEPLNALPGWFWAVILSFLSGGAAWKLGAWMVEKKLAERFELKDDDNPVIRLKDIGDFAQDEDVRGVRREVQHIEEELEECVRTSQLDAFGSRVNAFESVLVQTRERADSNADAIIRLQEAEQHRWKPIADMLGRIDQRLNAHEQAITKATTVLEAMEKRMDRHENRNRG